MVEDVGAEVFAESDAKHSFLLGDAALMFDGAYLHLVDILGLPAHHGDFAAAARHIARACGQDQAAPTVICHLNANNVEHILRRPLLKQWLVNNAFMLFDGIGMKVAAACLGKGWLSDINGTDLFPLVMEEVARTHRTIFLLGSAPGIAARAAAEIRKRHPAIVAGFRDGYFGAGDEEDICLAVNQSGASLLLVGLGCSRQESFVARNRGALKVPVIWAVGGLFDFVSGRHPRAPRFVRDMRAEWLFRWAVQPFAKSHRMLITYPRFIARILIVALRTNRGEPRVI